MTPIEATFRATYEDRVRKAKIVDRRVYLKRGNQLAGDIKVEASEDLSGMGPVGFVVFNGVTYTFTKTKYDLGIWTMKVEQFNG
jgi:hypothetical protein